MVKLKKAKKTVSKWKSQNVGKYRELTKNAYKNYRVLKGIKTDTLAEYNYSLAQRMYIEYKKAGGKKSFNQVVGVVVKKK